MTIFEPGFEFVRAQIVSDRYGQIWIHETSSDTPHDNRLLANDIDSFLLDFGLSLNSQLTIKNLLGKRLINKISLEEKYFNISEVMGIISRAVNESKFKFEHHYEVKSSRKENGYNIHDLELGFGELKLNSVFNSENSWRMLREINIKLAENGVEFRFAFLREYAWDAIHLLTFLSNEEYELLQKKNFVVHQLLK